MLVRINSEKPPNIYGVKEEDIRDVLLRYRMEYPQDDRTDEELRPYMIHFILKRRIWLLR